MGGEIANQSLVSLLREADGLYFDWEVPALTRPLVLTFIAMVRSSGKGKSRLRFQIDLGRLAGRTADLEKLHEVLALRRAGLDNRESLLRSIEWLLTISLEQTAAHLTDSERKLKTRQPYYFYPKQNKPRGNFYGYTFSQHQNASLSA